MDCCQTGYDSILQSTSIPTLHRHTTEGLYCMFICELGVEKDIRIMSDHTELAPRGAYRSVLHHDAVIRFGFSGIGILI